MFFADQAPTPYDLNFRLGSIPVRVHPFFWLMSAVLGYPTVHYGIEYLLAWIACVFVSILIHELGHVMMGRRFGSEGHILLYTFGGLAIGSSDLYSRWQRVAVLLAGPGIQLILFGIVYAVAMQLTLLPWSVTAFVIDQLLYINLVWALLNLVPVWPLDGGQISRELLVAHNSRDGVRRSLILSIACCVILGVYFGWYTQRWYPLILFGVLGAQSFQLLQFQSARGPQQPFRRGRDVPEEELDRAPWERDPDYWKK